MELLCKCFTTAGPLLDVTMPSLGSEWALPSGNMFCNPVFRKGLWKKMLVELIFRNFPIHPCFILVVIWAGMQSVVAPLNDSGFLSLPITRSFSCDLCIHFHNSIAQKSSLHNFCCTLKCKAFLVKSKLTDIHYIPDTTASFLPLKFLTFSCSITDRHQVSLLVQQCHKYCLSA